MVALQPGLSHCFWAVNVNDALPLGRSLLSCGDLARPMMTVAQRSRARTCSPYSMARGCLLLSPESHIGAIQ